MSCVATLTVIIRWVCSLPRWHTALSIQAYYCIDRVMREMCQACPKEATHKEWCKGLPLAVLETHGERWAVGQPPFSIIWCCFSNTHTHTHTHNTWAILFSLSFVLKATLQLTCCLQNRWLFHDISAASLPYLYCVGLNGPLCGIEFSAVDIDWVAGITLNRVQILWSVKTLKKAADQVSKAYTRAIQFLTQLSQILKCGWTRHFQQLIQNVFL